MEPLSLLIVDDHQLFREGLESLLRKIPGVTQIWHAATGEEALTMLEMHHPDVIFMDVRLPGINGIETTRRISESKKDARIIALTMMDHPSSVTHMLKAGAMGYLLKNTSFPELQEAIQAVLRGERYFSKNVSHVLIGFAIGQTNPSKQAELDVSLTQRELEVLGLICRGFTNKDISEILHINKRTVETHRFNIYGKLGVTNTADLAFYALQAGLVTR